MQLHVLFGQRFQRYDGQYAPEALEVIDEFSDEETSGVWLQEQYDKYQATGDFESLRIVTIDIPREALDAAFHPPTIKGTVVADDRHAC